ncbi:YheC/YheD family protein [Virgibacillus salidurans]|uniref:YheC/YheD family protein n=1 Tax=Virgibacillus salidurans TaxID=2831673 RepID=UPI001F3A89D8|nr:YheC/YheD family protein [Virgibacillus sp. NKC19-16]
MRNFNNPPIMAKITAMLCQSQDIDLIYLRPWDVDIHTNIVKGKMFINNKWEVVNTKLPLLIDIAPYCFISKHKEIIEHLRDNTVLTYDRKNSIDKERLQRELLKDKDFKHLVIPTCKIREFSDIEYFLDKYSSIVMKPIGGERGRGIYILRKDADTYILGHQKEEQRLSREELLTHYKNYIEGKRYILQKYISSKTKDGYPFDCRIHVQKSRKGKWEVARNFIRIGIGQKVISNVNQGGGISDPKPFLKANFGESWKDINKRLNQLATTLPYKLEEIKKTPVMALGFDVAIDTQGDLYLFESNGAPTTAPLIAQSAMLRTEYYMYMLENEIDVFCKQKVENNAKKS